MYKVLIVEDDPMVAMINEQYIKRNKNFQFLRACPKTHIYLTNITKSTN